MGERIQEGVADKGGKIEGEGERGRGGEGERGRGGEGEGDTFLKNGVHWVKITTFAERSLSMIAFSSSINFCKN